MTTEAVQGVSDPKKCPIEFGRHGPTFRERFDDLTDEVHAKCPVAWTDEHDGHWFASGMQEVFEIARRSDVLSNDNDVDNVKNGYVGITIPTAAGRYSPGATRGGFLEMDPPEQTDYRKALNPYLSPAAVARWIPVADEVIRACLDEHIESGSIDFVEHLANVVPAVMTMGLMGLPLKDWEIYCEPIHASVYTPPDSPEMAKVLEQQQAMGVRMAECVIDIQQNPRPGLINALLTSSIVGSPPPFADVLGTCGLLMGGGFDTTTALTAHSLEWLSQNPGERERLINDMDSLLDPATEEFLRFFTPAQGDGRTISADCEIAGVEFKEGERLWLSWAMANRSAEVFENPHEIDLERSGNRHTSFGLGIHRCIGSNVARALFKRMTTHVLERMPDYVCDSESAEHYATTGLINGMRTLPATFTPGERVGAGLAETIDELQKIVDEQALAEPVTKRKNTARL